MGILSPGLRRGLLRFAESSLGAGHLRASVEEPKGFYNPCLTHALFADELAGSDSRRLFLPLFGKALEDGLFTTIDHEAVERAHQPGAFLSEILVEWHTRPCVAAICALVALRRSLSAHVRTDADVLLARLVAFFGGGTAWGHGIERSAEVRDFVRLWSMAGCFALPRSPGCLPAFGGLRDRLLQEACIRGWSEDIESIRAEMEVLLGFRRPEDAVVAPAQACPAHAMWVLRREIPAPEILALLEAGTLPFEPDRFPWHAVVLDGSARDFGRFEPLAEDALRREDLQKVVALVKLEGLPVAIDRI
jgi:hypothetical protein